MLSFLVFEGDKPQAERVLRHAHLLGPESVPVAGEVRFEAGLILCTKSSGEATSLGVQVGLDQKTIDELGFAVGGEDGVTPPPGAITLRTCLLPERDRPYLLSLELARHRLMLYLNKLEDWQLFDLGPDHEITRLFERARHAFTEALVAQRAGDAEHGLDAKAHRLAVKSLWLAVEAGERLALESARRDFTPRVSGQIYEHTLETSPHAPASRQRATQPVLSIDRVGVAVPNRPAVGCSVSPASFTDVAQQVALDTLDYLQIPMRWIEMEPEEGKYFWRNTDQWIEWAVRRAKIPVVAGPVIDFRQKCVPRWLYVWENDYETLREFVYEHMKNLVTRYRRTIGRWVVLGGLHVNDNFHFTFDQMMDLTRICVLVVRKLHPTAQVILEITHPWGEYHTANRRSLPPMLYAEMVTQSGIMVDGFSLRVQMGQPLPGQSARDLMVFSSMLDRYAGLDKPLSLTAVGVPSGVPEAVGNPDLAEFHPGFWRAPWSERLQADWATAAMSIALAKPYIQSVTWQELYDMPDPTEMPRGGLISVDGTPKPVASRLAEIRNAVREGQLPERLRNPSWIPLSD
ncbi:MAG: endo-1,4-beta-xylanase [Phycisphaeraceae bacterium]|nr:MAG: endo-1,4-beta-xylanase [Phycisphaeraceae bacterium]